MTQPTARSVLLERRKTAVGGLSPSAEIILKAENLQALIDYRMQRAIETLEEARLMQTVEHWNTCANRLYYAAFYAVSALLVQDGHTASKHSGAKDLFNSCSTQAHLPFRSS